MLRYVGTDTHVVIPSFVTHVAAYAFYGSQVETVAFDEGVKTIGLGTLYFCPSVQEVFIGDSVEVIEAGAFAYCTDLRFLIIGSGVHTIGELAFYNCDALEEIYYKGTEAEWDALNVSFDSDTGHVNPWV